MNKIYGYKQKDIIVLASEIKTGRHRSLTSLFKEVGKIQNKSTGTNRNMYYALAKLSKEDKEFCENYLGGKEIKVGKIKEFNSLDEKELLKNILLKKKDGYSVRRASLELSNGDSALALRYQNKYRSTIAKKPKLIAQIIAEIKDQTGDDVFEQSYAKPVVSEVQLTRLKNEINNLVSKVAYKEKKENEYLKQRLSILEVENARLNLLLLEKNIGSKQSALKYFKVPQKPEAIN